MALPVNLDHKYLAVIDEAREVAQSVESWAMEADESSVVHQATVDALRASRLAELMVPSSHGGRFESVDPLAVCLAREVLMKTSSHLDSLFALQGIGSYAISLAGTEEQRREWLPRVATCEVLAALALTEPVAGSDLKGVTTTVEVRDGDLVLNGQKSFISNAGSAGFYTTLAREGDGYSLVLVSADARGLTVSASPEIIGPSRARRTHVQRRSSSRERSSRRTGPSIQTCARHALGVSDLGGRRGSRSHGRRAGGSRRHTRQREQFGRPLAKHGPVATLLADSWSDLEAARFLTYQTAAMAAKDPSETLDRSSLAKLNATKPLHEWLTDVSRPWAGGGSSGARRSRSTTGRRGRCVFMRAPRKFFASA